jgi:hypothetical protein
LAVVMAGGAVAHAKDPATGSWVAVERLKPGTKVVVEELSTPGDYRYQVPCKVVRVDEASLTCRAEGGRNQRIVYPAGQVLTVYQVKMRVTAGSWARIVLYAGAGFLMGCAITDEKPDFPLGGMGAVAGGVIGAMDISRGPKFEVVYWRTDAPAGGAVSP